MAPFCDFFAERCKLVATFIQRDAKKSQFGHEGLLGSSGLVHRPDLVPARHRVAHGHLARGQELLKRFATEGGVDLGEVVVDLLPGASERVSGVVVGDGADNRHCFFSKAKIIAGFGRIKKTLFSKGVGSSG